MPANRTSYNIQWGAREILLAVSLTAFALVVISGGSTLLLNALGRSTSQAADDPVATITLVVGQMLIDLAAVAGAAMVSLRRYRLTPRAWGLRRERSVALGMCLAVLAASFGTLVVYGAVVKALGVDALAPKSNVPQQLFEQRAVLPFTVFLVVIVAPLAEEMFFRGFVFNGLRGAGVVAAAGGRLRVPGAALISGLMWAAIHGQVGLVIPITIIGFLFALLLARTGSLWNAILVHFLFNLISVIGNLITGSG